MNQFTYLSKVLQSHQFSAVLFKTVTKNYCSQFSNHINLLQEYNFHKPTVENMLKSNSTQWNNISVAELKETVDWMKNYTFSENDITDILSKQPDICSTDKKELTETMETWLTCGFSVERLNNLFCVQPMLLTVPCDNIKKRMPTYTLMMNNRRNRMLIVLQNCPEIMFSNFDDVVERFNYIQQKMQIRPKELVESRALCYDIFHIKLRHAFLDRSGQYEYFTKKMSPHTHLENPSLNSIVDFDDKMFAEKIAKMDLLEYETFAQYFAQESDVESGEEEGFSSDEDT